MACKQPPFSYVKHWPLFDPFMQKEEEHEVSAVSFKKDTNLGIPGQWLGLSTFTAGHRFKRELGELKSLKPCDATKKKKKTLILLAPPLWPHLTLITSLKALSPNATLGIRASRTMNMRGAAAAAKSLPSCLTLCDPIDSSPPGSSVPGILQARILEWVAISFSTLCMHAKLLQSCPTLCNPLDSSPPGSSVHRIL